MIKQQVILRDLGIMDYEKAWEYQEQLMAENVAAKAKRWNQEISADRQAHEFIPETKHHILFVEHPPVYTIGKSGHIENLLLGETERVQKNIRFFKINRGGDITFHGPGQLVVYPILDLEKFYRDIGKYMRNLEEVAIRILADYNIKGDRSSGETGVWLDPATPGKARKICAIGIRCSRWITMHGLALNVNTDLDYFDGIVPCGIQNKRVTSLREEVQREIPLEEIRQKMTFYFEEVFGVEIVNGH